MCQPDEALLGSSGEKYTSIVIQAIGRIWILVLSRTTLVRVFQRNRGNRRCEGIFFIRNWFVQSQVL